MKKVEEKLVKAVERIADSLSRLEDMIGELIEYQECDCDEPCNEPCGYHELSEGEEIRKGDWYFNESKERCPIVLDLGGPYIRDYFKSPIYRDVPSS